MAEGEPLPASLPLCFDDPRMIDMHWGLPSVTIIGRPRMTPVRVNGYPVEFRVFHGGNAEDGAASFYYPQAGRFNPSDELQASMKLARTYAGRLHTKRADLGLTPWMPGMGDPDDAIGSTIDFMLTEEAGLVLVDAGPGYGFGAHPCCFIDQPVAGERWHLADGVALR